eukprot:8413668-Pyramimonas_sp.AAC.1
MLDWISDVLWRQFGSLRGVLRDNVEASLRSIRALSGFPGGLVGPLRPHRGLVEALWDGRVVFFRVE